MSSWIFLDVPVGFVKFYLTIRLWAQNFYEVIVNEGEARVNCRFIEIESE